MTLLEFAEKTSPVPLSSWQQKYLTMYEQAVKDEVKLVVMCPKGCGRDMVMKIINDCYKEPLSFCEPLEPSYNEYHPINVYCQGTKKIGIPCKRYLGKVKGEAELLCPICKTVNVIRNGKVKVFNKK